MADLSGVTENYFPTAHESFSDTLSSTILALATTVPITNLSEYNDGEVVVLTVEPGTANEATFVGVKASTPYRVTDVIWTEGNLGVGHNAGVTVIDYDSATHYNLLTKWMKLIANQDGTLKTQPIRDALGLGAAAANGWEVLPNTLSVASGYNKGNRESEITVATVDARTFLTPGMRLRLDRGTTPGTQCVDLEASSSQYATRASGSLSGSITSFTDDFTCEAWVKPESFGSTGIVTRWNTTNGWRFNLDASGRPEILGSNGGNNDIATAVIGVNLNEWSHVAATLDMSGATATIYINGISVPYAYTNGSATALVQAGDLQIGAWAATAYFDGKISDVRVWNVIRTQLQIRDNMNQQLVGSESNLVGYWKLSGDFNDSTSSANNLTGQGGAVATNTDNPFHSTEYGIITKVTYSAPNSTISVFSPKGYAIPNGTLSAPYYSVQRVPYGLPAAEGDWSIQIPLMVRQQAAGTAATWVNLNQLISIPTGKWRAGYNTHAIVTHAGTTFLSFNTTLSTANNSQSDIRFTARSSVVSTSTTEQDSQVTKEAPLELDSQTLYYLNIAPSASTTTVYLGDTGTIYEPGVIYAECAYV